MKKNRKYAIFLRTLILLAVVCAATAGFLLRGAISELFGRHNLVNGICTECGLITDDHIHYFDDGIILTEPGCIAPGFLKLTCMECGAEICEQINALGHNYEVKSEFCSRCNEKTHSHEDSTVFLVQENKKTSCIDDGSYSLMCSYCGFDKENYSVAAFGHAYDALSGICEICGGKDGSAFRVFGENLSAENLSFHDSICRIIEYVSEHGSGDCIDYANQLVTTAGGAGIRTEIRFSRGVKCELSGQLHDDESFGETGFCVCGLGAGHSWVRFISDSGVWYEADVFSGDKNLAAAENTLRWGIE